MHDEVDVDIDTIAIRIMDEEIVGLVEIHPALSAVDLVVREIDVVIGVLLRVAAKLAIYVLGIGLRLYQAGHEQQGEEQGSE